MIVCPGPRVAVHFFVQVFLVLHVVAVDTEQFPVAPVRGIIVVIVVLMMDREFAEFPSREFAAASSTDPRKQLEGPFPIGRFPGQSIAASIGDDPIHIGGFRLRLLWQHVCVSYATFHNTDHAGKSNYLGEKLRYS